MSSGGRLCGSENTATGRPCKNHRESCPVPAHRHPSAIAAVAKRPGLAEVIADGGSPATAGEDSAEQRGVPPRATSASAQIPDDLFGLIDRTAHRFDLSAQQIAHDYLLHKGLFGLARQYPPRSTVPDRFRRCRFPRWRPQVSRVVAEHGAHRLLGFGQLPHLV